MTRNKKLLQKSQTFKKLFYFVRESSGIKNGIEHEQINWNCMSLACASTKQCNLNKMDAQNNEANWRKHLPENHDTNDLKIQFVALLNYEKPKDREREREKHTKSRRMRFQIAQVRIIKSRFIRKSGSLRLTNDEEITNATAIFVLCVEPLIRYPYWTKAAEQMKSKLNSHWLFIVIP